jgi:hypothetical protein
MLKQTWPQIEWLHNCGASLIPVTDKQKGDKPPKMPFKGWKEHQSSILPLPDLWQQMEQHDTTAVAIICGKVSGHLEIIDIDVKYKPGIDAILLSDIAKFYPDIYNRLRIHKTPSGGYHILYRVPGHDIPGNVKLAGRLKTPDEITANPKGRTVNFLETRGEGGYAVAPPSLGYGIHQDQPIPQLTWEERCSLITLCQTYNELIEIEKPPRQSKSDNDYYDEDPWTHFNGSAAAETVLVDAGWKECRSNNLFTWYTRPGKDKGISASFNHKKRVYYIFTSSTDLDENKGYNPATLLARLRFNGNFKETFRWLTQNGYGKIKPAVEARMVKKNALSGRPLPKNASPTALAELDTARAIAQSTYPFGLFWEQDDEDGYKISREHLYTVADGLGWKVWQNAPVHINGYIVTKSTERQFYDALKAYIKEEDGDDYVSVCNAYEAFIQRNGAFSISRLQELDTTQIVKDTANACYKFYQNGYLFITAQAYSFNTYDTLTGLIWSDNILQRQYNEGPEGGRFVEFVSLATGLTDHIRKVIGYLSHQYKDETTGYIIVMTEQCPDPKQGGGSGKNILSSSFGLTTTYKSIPGSQVKFDEKFLNSWGGERIFALSDVPKRFDFMFLKDMTTGTGILKKLYEDEIVMQVGDMPKFIIQTNYSYEVTDGGLKRRIIPIEFTDFFTKCGGVDVHFGVHFPKGWDLADWTGYDNFIASCIQLWLSGGLKLFPPALTEGGWHKQFEQTYGQVVTGIIDEYFEEWKAKSWVPASRIKGQIQEYFKENATPLKYQPSMININNALKEWCRRHDIDMLANVNHRNDMGLQEKHYFFDNQEEAPF